ncbi:MAG: methyl-accepting chemotaxis protein [Phycisphaerales bacterium]
MTIYFIGAAILAVGLVVGKLVWDRRESMTIERQLTTTLLAIGFSITFVVGFLAIERGLSTIEHIEDQALEAVADARAAHIEGEFHKIQQQIKTSAENLATVDAMVAFDQAFDALPAELESVEGSSVESSLSGFYREEYGPRLREAGITDRGPSVWMPSMDSAKLAQWMYISDSPKPVGSKLDLMASRHDTTYDRVHAAFHPMFKSFLEEFGYYDIFLLDTEGTIVYSVFKEADYATNMVSGAYRDSNFAEVFRGALNASPGTSVTRDFDPYTPSYGAPASFTGSPVYDGDTLAGVLVFQMPVDVINDVMLKAEGMGETGQTMLIGRDGRPRSNSRFAPEGESVLLSDEFTYEVRATNEPLTYHTVNPAGLPVFVSEAPIEAEGFDMVVRAERGVTEMMTGSYILAGMIGLVGLGVMATLLFVARRVAQTFVEPVTQITGVIDALGGENADLSTRLDAERQDEFGCLAGAVNRFMDSLVGMVQEIVGASDRIASSSQQFSSIAHQIADGTRTQNQDVSAIAAALEELSVTAAGVADQCRDAAGAAEETDRACESGIHTADETIQGIRSVECAVQEGSEKVRTLESKGAEIGQITAVIDDIAEQTNLLALNATIEAARAGEHGRGFAVVADEVRQLADRTTASTAEIAQSINEIRQHTGEAIRGMQDGSRAVENGVELAGKTEQELRGIMERTARVRESLHSMVGAAEEQARVCTDVSSNIQSVSNAVSATMGQTDEVVSAADALATDAAQLREIAGRFNV